MQLMNVIFVSQRHVLVSAHKWFGNPGIICGIAFEVALILFIAYTLIGNALFGVTPIA